MNSRDRLKTKIKEGIRQTLPSEEKIIYNVLKNNGFETFIVGGAIRDIAINQIHKKDLKVEDWDLSTTARYTDMEKIFNKTLRVSENGNIVSKEGKTLLLIKRIETTGIKLSNKKIVEVTPLNKFVNDEIVFTNDIKEDLLKRDFTINAMSYNDRLGLQTVIFRNDGKRVDAISDIKDKLIQCIDVPEKAISRDYSIIIRGVYLANKLNFSIEAETLKAMKEATKNISKVDKNKLHKNFRKIIMSPNFDNIHYLIETGLVQSICPSWDDKYNEELISVFKSLSDVNKKYIKRLRHIYENFSNKKIALELFENLGVGKETLLEIKLIDYKGAIKNNLKFELNAEKKSKENEEMEVINVEPQENEIKDLIIQENDMNIEREDDITKEQIKKYAKVIGLGLVCGLTYYLIKKTNNKK